MKKNAKNAKNNSPKKLKISNEIIFDEGISAQDAAEKLSHYFIDSADAQDEIRYFDYKIADRTLNITSNSGVFSKNHVDRGSELLIKTVLKEADEMIESSAGRASLRIADLGTGYGIILLALASALRGSSGIGYELSNRALRLARINAKKNGLKDRTEFVGGNLSERVFCADEFVSEKFDIVVTNPPIRAGKNTVYDFFVFAHQNLKNGGMFYAVISKNQGAASAKKYLEELFGNADFVAKDGEFRIIRCMKMEEF